MREQFQYYFMSNIMYSWSFFKTKNAKELEETMDFFVHFSILQPCKIN